ncbi:MAG: TetR/AcrR family transcriptional regulator [Clostridia bacterium]|nr:TetR/AcrR family transcriptional regulator [Clostridia bacterium]
MAKKNTRNTKGRIVAAAWKLFYEQGYDDTTIEEIIDESGTSKGSFYHYFESKDALLGSLSMLFDEKYEEVNQTLDPEMNSFDKLMYFNQTLFEMIDTSIPLDLITQLYSSQLVTRSDKHLLGHNRVYYRLLRQVILEGQRRGQITDTVTVNEISKLYALCERALIYDWCLCGGEYSLKNYSKRIFPLMLGHIRTEG